MAGGPWSVEETNALLDVWGGENVQNQLDEISRNRIVYQGVVRSLSQLGYERTWQQCKTKIKLGSALQEGEEKCF